MGDRRTGRLPGDRPLDFIGACFFEGISSPMKWSARGAVRETMSKSRQSVNEPGTTGVGRA
jgi:hypothetical protein